MKYKTIENKRLSLEREVQKSCTEVVLRVCRAGLKNVAGYYQYRDRLNSSTLECNESGQVISYEEYYPYGRSAYRAAASGVDLSLKRYRFTGKERDEETGLDYFGVRYYASWLGRWMSGDPGGFVDGLNLYRYVRNNPVNGIDREGYSTENTDPPPLDPNGGVLPEGAIVNSTFTQEYSEFSSGGGVAAPAVGSVRSYQLPTEGGGWATYTAQFNKETGLFTGYKASAEELDTSADNLAYQINLDFQRQKFTEIYDAKRTETGKKTLMISAFVFGVATIGVSIGFVSSLAGASTAAQTSFTMASLGTRASFLTQTASRIAAPIASFAAKNPKSAQFLIGAADSIALESIASGVANTYRGHYGYSSNFSGDIDLADAGIAGAVNMIPDVPVHYKAGIELASSMVFDFNLKGQFSVIGDGEKSFENILVEAVTGLTGVGFKHMSFKDFDITGSMSIKNHANIRLEKIYPNRPLSSISKEIRKTFYDSAVLSFNKAVKFDLYGDIILKSFEIPGKAINEMRANGK